MLSNEPEGPGAEQVKADAAWYGVENVFLSGETGVEKPDPRAFEGAADRLGLSPKECVSWTMRSKTSMALFKSV